MHRIGDKPRDGSSRHQDFWIGHDGTADRNHLLFASRHGPCDLAAAFLQFGKEIIDPGEIFLLSQSRVLRIRAELQVLPYG